MDRRFCWCAIALGAFLVQGCSQESRDLRTYSEEHDGEAAAVEVADATTEEAPPLTPAAPEIAVDATPLPPAADSDPGPTADSPAASGETVVVTAPLPRPPRAPLPDRIAMLDGQEVALVAEGPREIELLIPEKDFARVDPDRSLRVSYDDLDLLKVLNMEPVVENCTDYFPDWLKSLDGQQVRIRGFMIPPPRETELPGFSLARDNQICCFGRDPKAYDVIPVLMKDGLTTDYIPNRPFDVVGRFFIRPDVFRGEVQTLYEIEDAEVISR